MERNSMDIIYYPLSVIRKLGLYTEEHSRKLTVIATMYISVFSFLNIAILMQFSYIKGDLFEFVYNVEAFGVFAQTIGKIACIAYQQDKLTVLVKATKHFWNTTKCIHEIKVELNNIFERILNLEKLFFISSIITVVVMYLALLFGRPLILGVWNTEYNGFYKIVLCSQMSSMLVVTSFVPAFDCLFLSLCAKVITQFRILCCCFKQLNVSDVSSATAHEKYYSKLRVYIHQHAFLLKFTRSLQEVYSFAILCEYATVSSLICTNMYALLDGANIQLLTRCGVTLFSQLLQLAFYCIPADFVTTEMLAVSDAVFESNWYSEYSPKLRRPLILIIQRSQKENIFTAGGLFEIRTRSLLAVLRVSWAACTLFRALK